MTLEWHYQMRYSTKLLRHPEQRQMTKQKEPKEGEFWWAWPPSGGGAEPVEIMRVFPTGNHALVVLGRSEWGYSKEWSLIRPIGRQPQS